MHLIPGPAINLKGFKGFVKSFDDLKGFVPVPSTAHLCEARKCTGCRVQQTLK